MKVEVKVPQTIDITHVKMSVAVRYDEEDMPNDFPFRSGDMWNVTIEIDSGKIVDWPVGVSHEMYMKVCDQGSYYLLDASGKEVASIENDYVPNRLIPGEYGDYIDLKIDANGVITNWKSHPSVEDFFPED